MVLFYNLFYFHLFFGLSDGNGAKFTPHGGHMESSKNSGQVTKKSPPSTPAFKKRHRGCSFCILDIENGPIPEFTPEEEVVGVISMEDVIEELLQVIHHMLA